MSRNFSAELTERTKSFGITGVSSAYKEYESKALSKYKPFHLTVLLICDPIWCLIYQLELLMLTQYRCQ